MRRFVIDGYGEEGVVDDRRVQAAAPLAAGSLRPRVLHPDPLVASENLGRHVDEDGEPFFLRQLLLPGGDDLLGRETAGSRLYQDGEMPSLADFRKDGAAPVGGSFGARPEAGHLYGEVPVRIDIEP